MNKLFNASVGEELQKELKGVIRHNSVEQFALDCRIIDKTELVDMYKNKLKGMPSRGLLRKIADHSNGRVPLVRLYDICGYSEKDLEEDTSWKNFVPKRGQVYMADLGYTEFGIQGGIRPFYIVQNDTGNKYSPSIVGIPITTVHKNRMSTHAHLIQEEGIKENSVVISEQITTKSKRCFYYNGYPNLVMEVSLEKQAEIQTALEKELGFIPLMFDEGKAFEMIKHIRTLKTMKKYHQSKDLIDILNNKIEEFTNYCKKYYINAKDVIEKYKSYENEKTMCLDM